MSSKNVYLLVILNIKFFNLHMHLFDTITAAVPYFVENLLYYSSGDTNFFLNQNFSERDILVMRRRQTNSCRFIFFKSYRNKFMRRMNEVNCR